MGRLPPALEAGLRPVGGVDPGHARDLHGRGHDLAEVDRLAEGEVVRVEETPAAVGQVPVAEDLQQGLLDLAAEVARLRADHESQVQGHEAGPVDLQVLPGQAEALQEAAQLRLEVPVHGQTAHPVHGEE